MFMRTATARRFTVLTVVVAFVLSLLSLGNVDRAEAQQACSAGTLVGLFCEFEGPAPALNAAGVLACPADHAVVDTTRCVRYELAPGVTCAVGELVLDKCTEESERTILPPVCPTSATVFLDGDDCYTLIPKTSECPTGTTLDPGGAFCQEPVATVDECPTGFTLDTATSMCVSSEPATQAPAACPPGAQGVPDACFTLVPQDPATQSCATGDLVGSDCIVTGAPPVSNGSTCPVSQTVFEVGADCFSLDPAGISLASCVAPYSLVGVVCRTNNPDVQSQQPFTCPAGPDGVMIVENFINIGSGVFIESCEYSPPVLAITCPAGSTPNADDPLTCRVPEPREPNPPECVAGFDLNNGECTQTLPPTVVAAACPTNTTEDPNDPSQCRLSTANAPDTFTCADANAVLDGTNCVTSETITERCPATGAVIVGSDVCFNQVDLPEPACPAGTVMEPGEPQCRVPVDFIAGGSECPDGFEPVTVFFSEIVPGAPCLRFTDPTPPPAATSTPPVATATPTAEPTVTPTASPAPRVAPDRTPPLVFVVPDVPNEVLTVQVSAPPPSPPLALTGVETDGHLFLATAALSSGFSMLGLAHRRRQRQALND